MVFVGVVVTRKDDSSAQLFTSQSTIDVNLVVCGTAFFLAFFSLQSLQQDVETQKTMVRHLEKRVQQVELDAQEKVCEMFNHSLTHSRRMPIVLGTFTCSS